MKRSLFIILLALSVSIVTNAQDAGSNSILIVYDGATASVTVPESIKDVDVYIEGADVYIDSYTTTQEYTYRVTGSSPSCYLQIYGNYKMILELAGVNLTNPNGDAVINVDCGKRTDLVLVEGTINTLMDSEGGAQKGALYFKGHADFKGGGTLNITGKCNHAICAKEEIELKSSVGVINVLGAVKDGIHCGRGKIDTPDHNYFEMDGGTVNITNVGSDGIDADDYGNIIINGGALSVNTSKPKSDGVKADNNLEINGGEINLNVNAVDSEGLSANNRITINDGHIQIVVKNDGSKAIKAKRESEEDAEAHVYNGGYLDINGGAINIYVSGSSNERLDGTVSKCMGISVDADMNQAGGVVLITTMGPEVKAINVKGENTKTDGIIKVTHGPWLMMDTDDYEFDMSCFVRVYRNGIPLTDYSNVAVGAFIGTECMGLAEFEQSEYGYVRVYYDCTDDDPVYFKLYDNLAEREYSLTSDRDILFSSQGLEGMPSAPIRLDYTAFLLGDVNGDGLITLSDAIMILYRSFGVEQDGFIEAAADVNGDNDISLSDAIEVLYKSFGVDVNWTKPRAHQTLDPD